MKKIFPIVVILSSLMAQSCGELLQVAGGIAQAAGGAYFEQTAERYGYSREDATSMTNFLAEGLFGNTENVNKGIAYVTASDQYIKRNIIAGEVLNEVGELTGQQQITGFYRDMLSAHQNYLSESSHATTAAERQAAFDRRSQNWADVTYDAYETVKEQRARYLSEKSSLANSLRAQGYDSDQALEIAGSILAVQRADYMTPEEKEEYITAFFPNDPAETVMATVQKVESGNYSETPATSQPSAAEIAAQREAEARAKAKAEKDAAIGSVKSALLDSYKLDSTELNDEQKATLDRIAVVMNQYPDLTLQIKGHTCDIGTNSVNDRVGLRRAEAAKAYLLDKGIAANRISTVSGGENEPVVENNSADNRKQNRRLTFEIN